MKATILPAILLALSLVLSGCIIGTDDPEPHDDPDQSGQGDDPDAGGGHSGEDTGNATGPSPPHAQITASDLTGTVPFTVTFNLTSESENPQWFDWSFDADGNGTLVKTGYGLPAEVAFEFTEPGEFTARLDVTDIDGLEGHATLVIQAVAPPPAVIPEPIVFEGTTTGVWYLPSSGEHLFNVTVPLQRITLAFEGSLTAIDLDFTVYDGAGNEAGKAAAGNEPTGLLFAAAEPDIVIDDPAILANLGEWKVVVEPFIAVEGDYKITITFE